MRRLMVFLVAGLLSVALLGAAARPAAAFLYDIPVYDEPTIAALSDEKLLDTYVEVLIEMEASTTFSRTAGFNKQEYEKYKGMIRYRVRLMNELKRRRLEVPGIDSPCW